VLAGQHLYRGIAGLSGLYLSSVCDLTPRVAAILATHKAGELALSGMQSITEDVARELVKHPLLALDGVRSLNDRTAAILARHTGASLSLRNLQQVSPAALAKLRANVGIALPPRLRPPPSGRDAAITPPARTGLTREAMIAAIARIVGS
jgi:hypothetical protein